MVKLNVLLREINVRTSPKTYDSSIPQLISD